MTPTRQKTRKVESFADWMARIDADVEEAARAIQRDPPTYADLNAAQKRIVQMLIEHLRKLPPLQSGDGVLGRGGKYSAIASIIAVLFAAEHSENGEFSDGWAHRLPKEKKDMLAWLSDNCCTLAPVNGKRRR